jgi:hypothetical protein
MWLLAVAERLVSRELEAASDEDRDLLVGDRVEAFVSGDSFTEGTITGFAMRPDGRHVVLVKVDYGPICSFFPSAVRVVEVNDERPERASGDSALN